MFAMAICCNKPKDFLAKQVRGQALMDTLEAIHCSLQ